MSEITEIQETSLVTVDKPTQIVDASSKTINFIKLEKRSEMEEINLLRPLTTPELCEYLRVAKSTVDRYNREGMPRFYVGRECRYFPSKVLDWLERRSLSRTGPTEETFDLRKELNL